MVQEKVGDSGSRRASQGLLTLQKKEASQVLSFKADQTVAGGCISLNCGHHHSHGEMPGTLRRGCLLCREHPELSEGLCVEMMTRQLADSGGHTLQHQVLTALAPWMENLSFRPRWEGERR